MIHISNNSSRKIEEWRKRVAKKEPAKKQTSSAASKSEATKKPSLRSNKKQQTVRERSQQDSGKRIRRVRSAAGKLKTPFKKAHKHGKREVHVVPLPDNKVGRVLGKRVRFVPKFVREAFGEIRLVTWPTARETVRLTTAVFIFSVVFAVIVGVIDFGLDKLFREVIIGK